MMGKEEQGKAIAKLVAKAWSDETFKQRLLSDPMTVLKEEGIAVPEGVQVKVVEDTPTLSHFLLPMKPSEILSDDQLTGVSGGDGCDWECSKLCGVFSVCM